VVYKIEYGVDVDNGAKGGGMDLCFRVKQNDEFRYAYVCKNLKEAYTGIVRSDFDLCNNVHFRWFFHWTRKGANLCFGFENSVNDIQRRTSHTCSH
jgi:hypothetical protein